MEDLNNSEYHHIFRISKSVKIIRWSFTLIIILLGIYLSYSNLLELALWVVGVSISLFITQLLLLNNKLIIKLSNKGVWTKKFGLIYWSEIDFIRIDNKSHLTKSFYNELKDTMVIYLLNDRLKSVSIDITGVKERKTILSLSKYYIEKQKNEKN